MKVYHMSQTLQVGDKLKAGYKRNEIRCREVISTLEQSEQCLKTTIASMKLQGDEWREYVKWCVEGIFEFVRETEFSFLPSRLNCSYYFDNIEYYKVLYEAGWAQKSEEERAQIRLFEVDLAGCLLLCFGVVATTLGLFVFPFSEDDETFGCVFFVE